MTIGEDLFPSLVSQGKASENSKDDDLSWPPKSLRGRPLKRPQPYEPVSPQRVKKASTPKPNSRKTSTSSSGPSDQPIQNADHLVRVEALLARVELALLASEKRAEKAEKRLLDLEELIRDQILPRVSSSDVPLPSSNAATPQTLPLSPPSTPPPTARVPSIGLDLSRTTNHELKVGNAGTIRRRADDALKKRRELSV
jgi:hypothetical protein